MKNKVIEFVVEPLNAWFGKELTDTQASVYVEVLNGYAEDSLQKSVKELKATWIKRWHPLPANIKEVCDRYSAPLKTPSSIKHFWQLRDERVNDLVEKYLDSYKNNALYNRAFLAGWHRPLMEFVRTCARIQAQVIEQAPHVSYSGMALGYLDWNTPEGINELVKANREKGGFIDVEIPYAAIKKWEQLA